MFIHAAIKYLDLFLVFYIFYVCDEFLCYRAVFRLFFFYPDVPGKVFFKFIFLHYISKSVTCDRYLSKDSTALIKSQYSCYLYVVSYTMYDLWDFFFLLNH